MASPGDRPVRGKRHAMAAVAVMVMVQRALLIMRGILMIRMMVIATLGCVNRLHHLAGVTCKHTTLQPDKDAEQREPCEQRSHQRPNPSCKTESDQGICFHSPFGSVIFTENPPLSGSEALVSPPQAWMAVRTMARPRPLPPVSRLRERSMR